MTNFYDWRSEVNNNGDYYYYHYSNNNNCGHATGPDLNGDRRMSRESTVPGARSGFHVAWFRVYCLGISLVSRLV